MSAPFVYIGTYRLKEGKLDAFKQMCGKLAQFVESYEPRVIAFNVYSNEDGSEASVGVPLIVKPHPLGGLIRSAAGQTPRHDEGRSGRPCGGRPPVPEAA